MDGVVLTPLGLKSYAHLYYGNVMPLNGSIKKEYALSKIQDKERFLKHYQKLKMIGEKNGFVFYEFE